MVGRKLYYELSTGNVVLEIPEKHPENAVNTTKEQDFLMYDSLQGLNHEMVGLMQLEYGQYSGEFQSVNSVRVDLATGDLLFEYPRFDPPLITQMEQLKTENQQLRLELDEQKSIVNAMLGVTD